MSDDQFLTTNKPSFNSQGLASQAYNSLYMGAQKLGQYVPTFNFNTGSFMNGTNSEALNNLIEGGYKPLYDANGNFSGKVIGQNQIQQNKPTVTNFSNIALPTLKSNYQMPNAPVAENISYISPYQFKNNNNVNALGLSQNYIRSAGQYNPVVNQDAFNQRQIQNDNYNYIDNEYRGQHLNDFINAGSLADFFRAAILGHQDRADMARATDLLKQNNQLAANNIENINNTSLQNIENMRSTGLGLGQIANNQNQIENNFQEAQAKNLLDTANFNLNASREKFNEANSSYQNQLNAQQIQPQLEFINTIRQLNANPIVLNSQQAAKVAPLLGTDYNLVLQKAGGDANIANSMISNEYNKSLAMNALSNLKLQQGNLPVGNAPAETTYTYDSSTGSPKLEVKGSTNSVLQAMKSFPSLIPQTSQGIPVTQNGSTIVK